MKNKSIVILIVVFLIGFALIGVVQRLPHTSAILGNQAQITSQSSQSLTWQVFFSPNGGCTEAVVNALNQAKTSVLVQAYSFTSRPIADALVSAHNRGVKVETILDKSDLHGKGVQTVYLAESEIPVSIDSTHAIAHNKVMVIDGETLLTGSFNFTNAAESHNAENLLIVHDHALADRYTDNWHLHRQHSQAYQSQPEALAA